MKKMLLFIAVLLMFSACDPSDTSRYGEIKMAYGVYKLCLTKLDSLKDIKDKTKERHYITQLNLLGGDLNPGTKAWKAEERKLDSLESKFNETKAQMAILLDIADYCHKKSEEQCNLK